MFLPAVREGDWTQVRKNFQKLSSIKLGDRASVTHAELTLTGLTASRLVYSDANKKLTSVADLTSWVAGTANEIDITDNADGTITIGIVDPLIVAKGGTGAATLTDHGILLGSGTGAITPLGTATNGQLPIGSTGADPVLAGLTGTTNQITVTNGAGSITLSTPQDIHTGASPIFTGLTLSGLTQGSILFAGTGGVISEDNSEGFYDSVNKRWGFGTNAPDSIFHIKANVPGTVGSHPAGQLIIQDPDDTVFGNAVITGYESDGAGNPDQQLWYLGSSSSSDSNIIFLNRRNSKLQLGTNGVSQLTILGDGKVGINEVAPQDTFEVNGTVLVKDKLKFTQDDGNEFIDSLADGYMDYGATTAHRFNNTVEVSAKAKITSIGGYAIKLTNTTGAVTVQGQTVKVDSATNDAVILTAADDSECIGVFLDAGVADDAEAWVVVSGIADIAMEDNTAATRGNWVQTSETEAGYADSTDTSPQAAPQHFNEIGHCIESVVAGGGGTHILARCILHFN